MADPVKLELVAVGDGYVHDSNDVLDKAKAEELREVVVAGINKEGRLILFSSHGRPSANLLLDLGKLYLLGAIGNGPY